MTEEEIEKELQRFYELGLSEGYKNAAHHIMDAAKASFERHGTEGAAQRLRHLANEIHIMANKAHPGEPDSTE